MKLVDVLHATLVFILIVGMILATVRMYNQSLECKDRINASTYIRQEREIRNLSIENQNLKMYCDNTSASQAENVTTQGLVTIGLARGDHFIVWTKNRTITSVLETCTHEYAHCNLGLTDRRK